MSSSRARAFSRAPSPRFAFTLIELLVVIAIIAVLIGLLVPAVQKVREAASRAKCQTQLKQLALACHSYHDAVKAWPRAGNSNFKPWNTTTANELSWHAYILPYIEQSGLFEQIDFRPGPYDANGGRGPKKNEVALNRVALFLCPTATVEKMLTEDPNYAITNELVNGVIPYTTHYYGIMGPKGTNVTTLRAYGFTSGGSDGGFSQEGVFQRDRDVRMRDIKDGASNTLAIGELSFYDSTVGSRYRSWIRGCDSTPVCGGARNVNVGINVPGYTIYMDQAMGSQHSSGTNFALADGGVKYLTNDLSMTAYRAMASRSGEEVISANIAMTGQ